MPKFHISQWFKLLFSDNSPLYLGMTTTMLNKIKLLPATKQKEIEDFVEFLASKYLSVEEESSLQNRRMQIMGRYKGKIKMSNGFNQTPDDFQDYI
ncbi:DUF2281 domain-containing protein [Pelobium manganitolerans]|uniref:DUF2281 domain-containing protein n=1 Tax=Pelobium manganitolerans TaxID=1842495 RepID=UPI003FA3D55B